MPEQRAAAQRGAAAAPQQEEGGMQATIRAVVNGLLIFFAIQATFKFLGFNATPQTQANVSKPPPTNFDAARVDTYAVIPETVSPLWPNGEKIDVSVYLSESPVLPPLLTIQEQRVFNERGIELGDWDEKRSVSLEIPISDHVKNNGSIFAHIYLATSGATMDPRNPEYDARRAYRIVKPLNKYMPKKKVVKTKKLIGGEDPEEEVEEKVEEKGSVASYWHANLTMDLVTDSGVLGYNTLAAPMRQHVVLERGGARDESGRNGWYYPIVFLNEFWQLKDHMVEINNTVTSLPLHINLAPIPWWKFQVYASMDFSFKQQAANPGLGGGPNTGAELEEFKRVLVETNVYLLGTTFIVSILHSIFEMLAFKNDIAHWRNKKDNVGISVRTILANVFMQSIIFLYLLDNSDGTSWMILMGQGFGILLEAWKITRTVNVHITPDPNSIFGYKIVVEDKHQLSSLEKETQAYDQEAFKYLYVISVPLLIAYAIYSLLYDTHKSWYSFVIETLVGSVYAYGFLMMVPSLWINYRLKSVAHMPRRTMVYKLLNTFIDDLFAFTIKMPTLHRMATLRDDIVYFIALYQAWVYRVDYRRVNEFGQVADVEGEDGEKKEEEEKGGGVKAVEGKASAVEERGRGKKRK
ncbi:hypothetical protein RUND412_007135 [Rhizina undulata]